MIFKVTFHTSWVTGMQTWGGKKHANCFFQFWTRHHFWPLTIGI